MAAIDIWKQYNLRGNIYWYDQYVSAAKYNVNFWTFGYRLEDLEIKLNYDNNYIRKILSRVSSPIAKLRKNNVPTINKGDSITELRELRYNFLESGLNQSSIYKIKCGDKGNPLRIGLNDFRADSRDVCQIFVSTVSTDRGPQTLFEIVPLDEGAFALRSLATGYFLSAIPPPQDNTNLPWKLVIVGSSPGYSGRFRLTNDSHIYSAAIGINVHCSTI
jgi:hypothetical protein